MSAAGTGGVPGAHLLERDRQLAALFAALAGARAGGGAVSVVQGPAGIGKSRLLAAACEHATGHGIEVLSARGIELDQELPFGVTSELFEARLASGPGAERERLLAGHASLAASLFDPAAVASSADPQALVRGLYWLTANIAGETGPHGAGPRQPLMISIDDAQWSDRSSLRFVSHLAARIEELPIALRRAC